MTRIEGSDTRRRVSALAIVQWTAVGLGAILLGWYGATRAQRHFAGTNAIERFRASHVSKVAVVQFDQGLSKRSPEPPEDTSLWSEERVSAYQRTLFSDSRSVLAALSIPRFDLTVPVFDGTDNCVLDRGAGRIEGTSWPATGGNIGIASHRDGFFRVLKNIELGDAVILETCESTIT